MAVSLYMDVHVPQAIADQLRRRGVDVLTAADDGFNEASDDQLLERARALGRLLFTQDRPEKGDAALFADHRTVIRDHGTGPGS